MTEEPQAAATRQFEQQRLQLEVERLRFDRQKASLDLMLRRRELRAPKGRSWREMFANPLALAVVGGFLTLMTTTVTNSFNAANTIAAERAKASQALQADLIKRFVESPRIETVRANLTFLADVGLLPDYADGIRIYLAKNPDSAPTSASTGLQTVRNDDDAIDLVLRFEGGLSEDPADPENGTVNFGITRDALGRFLGKPRDEVGSAEVRALTRETAREVYRQLYLSSGLTLKTVKLRAVYLGMAVNLGPSRASRIIQQAAAKASGSTVLADGVLGPATLAQINAMDEDRLVEFISCEWAGFYRNLAATRPEMEKLMKGWLARVEAYRPAQPKGLCAY